MFRRKLLALDFMGADNFNVDDEACFRSLVVWLEDQKVRHYRIEDRGPLRDVKNAQWPVALQVYLQDLNCPYLAVEKTASVDWLLGLAVRQEYLDDAEKYKSVTPASIDSTTRETISNNPLDFIDFDSPDFKKGIMTLAGLLQVPPYSDHKEMAKAICILVRDRLNARAIEAAGKSDAKSDKKEYIPFEKTELGFDAGDYISNDAAKILRLLYIRDLRDLQTQINRAIVSVQALTADPKTDQRLGKVGR